MTATEIGDAVHRLLEIVDLREPRCRPTSSRCAAGTRRDRRGARADRGPRRGLLRVRAGAARVAALDGARPELPFAFEHDGVLLHGRLDVLHRDGGRALVVDFKTNVLGDRSPEEIVEADYTLQRLVYALACLRAGDEEVEVVYVFLERPEEVVARRSRTADLPALEAELSAAIARIDAGEFVPTPGRVHLLGLPGARPRLRGAAQPEPARRPGGGCRNLTRAGLR